jgi:hypothetical protein
MGRYQQIIRSDWLAGGLKLGSDITIISVSRHRER